MRAKLPIERWGILVYFWDDLTAFLQEWDKQHGPTEVYVGDIVSVLVAAVAPSAFGQNVPAIRNRFCDFYSRQPQLALALIQFFDREWHNQSHAAIARRYIAMHPAIIWRDGSHVLVNDSSVTWREILQGIRVLRGNKRFSLSQDVIKDARAATAAASRRLAASEPATSKEMASELSALISKGQLGH